MHKDKACEHIKQNLSSNEDLVGFFQAQKPCKFWLYFIIGPLILLATRNYFIAVTNKGIHFHMLNFLGKYSQHDFFSYTEIEKIKIGKGVITIPITFFFSNGAKLKIKAFKKGVKDMAKLEENTLDYINKHIRFY
jgi:hypothetical protein